MIDIREITSPIGPVIRAAEALGRAHYEEIARNKDVMRYAPDIIKYEAIQAKQGLLVLGAYMGDELVGYSVNLLFTHLHYAELRCCQNDLIFVRVDQRGGTGVRLIQATRTAARQRGAQFMLWHAKPDSPLARLLVRLGCGVQDTIFSEVL